MQCPIDPHEQSGLLSELVSGGIAALVAERIVERKGKPMPATAEPHTHSEPGSNGAPHSPEPVLQRGWLAPGAIVLNQKRCAAREREGGGHRKRIRKLQANLALGLGAVGDLPEIDAHVSEPHEGREFHRRRPFLPVRI